MLHTIQCDLQLRNCFWLQFKFSKSFVHRSSDVMSAEYSNLESYVIVLPINHLQTDFRVQALLSDTCRALRLAESASPFGSCPLHSSINEL